MSSADLRTRIERLATLPGPDREREAGAAPVPEPALLELIDEVRDLVMTDLDRALAMADALRLVADRLDLPVARARSRCAWAHALNYANRFEQALAVLDDAASIARDHALPLEEARSDLAKIQSLARLARFEEAIAAAERAQCAFEANDQPSLALRAVTNHAIILRMLGRWGESVDRFDRALELARDDPTTTAQIQSNRAESLLELGRFKAAEQAFRQSCDLLESAGMERVAAIVRGNLADLLGRQGRLSESIQHFESARRFFERDRAAGDLARIESELADVLAAVGLIADAATMYEHACHELSEAGLTAEHARALGGLGALLVRDDPDRASAVLARAHDAFEAIGSQSGVSRIRLLQARLALRKGDTQQAARLAGPTEDASHESPIHPILRATILAEIAALSGDLIEASSEIERALGLAEKLSLPPVLADLHHRLGRIRAEQGRPDEAIDHLRRAMTEIERIRGALRGDRFRAAFLGDHTEIYQDTADAVLDSGTVSANAEALGVTERARSRALLDLIQGGMELADHASGAAESSDEARLLERLAAERARLNYLYSRLDPSGETGSQRPLAEWMQDLGAAESEVNALESRLEASRTGRGILATPAGAEELVASMPADRAMLVYARRRDGLGCFCVRDTGVEFINLALPLERLEELSAQLGFQLRRVVTRGPGDSARARRRVSAAVRAARALHDAVLAPMLPLINDRQRLTVVPFADLHLVPFTALHDGERYLVERFAVSRLPSASLSRVRGDARDGIPGPALVVGAPDRFAPEILPEVESVAAALPGSTLLAGADATADNLVAKIGHAGIVHIASHAMFPPGNPLASAIKLADRWLTVREVFALRLPGSVVTLSGCETGRTEVESGEEIYGFVRSFLAAGAEGVISSLWSAHDRVTRDLMTRMYSDAPPEGAPVARVFAGLRGAQRHAIGQGLHPGLWSGFVAVGTGE